MSDSQNFVHSINREKNRGTQYTAVLCFVIVATKNHNFELIIIFICCKFENGIMVFVSVCQSVCLSVLSVLPVRRINFINKQIYNIAP